MPEDNSEQPPERPEKPRRYKRILLEPRKNSKGTKLLTATAVSNRNADIWDMFCANFTQRQIAAHFGMSQSRVGQILNEWAETDVTEIPRVAIARARATYRPFTG